MANRLYVTTLSVTYSAIAAVVSALWRYISVMALPFYPYNGILTAMNALAKCNHQPRHIHSAYNNNNNNNITTIDKAQ